MKKSLSIVWFYRDLRLSDHEALSTAAKRGDVLPLYIDDPSGEDGGASKWWLHAALESLARDFEGHGLSLILKKGPSLAVLRHLISQTGATSVSWSRRYEPVLAKRDKQIALALQQDGIEVSVHEGYLLFEPERIQTKAATPFKVFTPFSKACFAAPSPNRPLPIPQKLSGPQNVSGDTLSDWHLVPRTATWPQGLNEAWDVSEKAAVERLHEFIEDALMGYKIMRDRPDIEGTSRMSPYLHFGQISPRQIWHAIHIARANAAANASSSERYLLEILWREFSWHLLHHIPDFTSEPLQKSFGNFPWRQNDKELHAWQHGHTGYPIIDAGMRELWQTGWMHNRVRMIVASFLIKDLLIDWRIGMAWFWDTLVDADLGSNTASWQWVAGCGADAAPYFRIFNPTLQGVKFDPKGEYVRRFVPELSELDTKFIHEPCKAPASVLAKAGISLGKTYPLQIVDHAKARLRALEALKATKGETAQASEFRDLFD